MLTAYANLRWHMAKSVFSRSERRRVIRCPVHYWTEYGFAVFKVLETVRTSMREYNKSVIYTKGLCQRVSLEDS